MITTANEASVKVSTDNKNPIDVKAANVVKHLKNIQGLSKLANRKSIMTMSSPGLYQYPIIASASIDNDYLMAIAKGYQLTYASSVVIAYSLNGSMNRADTPQISDFVQTFHQNNPNLLTGNINGAANVLGIGAAKAKESYASIPEDAEITVESAKVTHDISTDELLAISLASWDDPRESLVMESLNDMYKPYERTRRILQEKINFINESKASAATEADNSKFKQFFDANTGIGATIDTAINGEEKKRAAHGVNPTTKTNEKIYNEKTGKLDKSKDYTRSQAIIPQFKNEVVRNNQLEAMEPTMVNVQVIAYGSGTPEGNDSQSVHNITLGVKAMPRVVNSSVMISSLIEACKESHGIFKFLKWTKGEMKTADMIFGYTDAKSRAITNNDKAHVKFLQQSKKRKGFNAGGKFLKNNVLPTTSLVITEYEAARVKEECGVDLTELSEAIKFMSKYYLLSFAVYDTEQNTMKVLFDCDSDWGYTTIGSLKSAVAKTNDVMNQNEIIRIFGRR
jgi:hypothetical protein